MHRIERLANLEVHVTRGQTVESRHLVDAVVVDSKGQVVTVYGNEQALVFPRSSIKMLQAVSLVESGAIEKFSLSQAHLAIASSSHWGDEKHTSLVGAWLNQLSLEIEDLVCHPHEPYDEKTRRQLIRSGQPSNRLHNNCSGKHTGLLCTCLMLKENFKFYEKWDHFIQIRLRKVLSELAGIDMEKAPWGVDGCGIPTYAVPLDSLATAFSALLLDRAWSPDRLAALKAIQAAVITEPHLIAGESAFCTDMIRGSRGKVVVKTGAEGVYCGACLNTGFAFALKVKDGATRASELAAAILLQRLGGLSPEDVVSLARHTRPVIRNWEGEIVGKRFVPEQELA